MTPSDEYRDPVVKDILDQARPPAHGADFWASLDQTLAAEPAPSEQPAETEQTAPVIPLIAPPGSPSHTATQSPTTLAEVPRPAWGNQDAPPAGGPADNLVSLDSRRNRTPFIAAVAAAVLLLVGLGAVLLRPDSSISISDSAVAPITADEIDLEQEEVDESSALSPNTAGRLSETGIATPDGASEYYIYTERSQDGAECPERRLAAGTLGTNAADTVFDLLFVGDVTVYRSVDGDLAVVEQCGDNGRLIWGADAPAGGFVGSPTTVEIGADFDLDQDLQFDIVLTNVTGISAINPWTGAVVSSSDCSGVRVPVKPLRGDVPDVVAETRSQIAKAARVCDYDQLAALTGAVFVGDSDTPLADWQASEAANDDVMGTLVGALNTTAVFILDPASEGDELYSWPRAIIFSCEGMPDEARAELFEELGYNEAELIEDCDQIGAYAGLRVAITPDGQWRYFTERAR